MLIVSCTFTNLFGYDKQNISFVNAAPYPITLTFNASEDACDVANITLNGVDIKSPSDLEPITIPSNESAKLVVWSNGPVPSNNRFTPQITNSIDGKQYDIDVKMKDGQLQLIPGQGAQWPYIKENSRITYQHGYHAELLAVYNQDLPNQAATTLLKWLDIPADPSLVTFLGAVIGSLDSSSGFDGSLYSSSDSIWLVHYGAVEHTRPQEAYISVNTTSGVNVPSDTSLSSKTFEVCRDWPGQDEILYYNAWPPPNATVNFDVPKSEDVWGFVIKMNVNGIQGGNVISVSADLGKNAWHYDLPEGPLAEYILVTSVKVNGIDLPLTFVDAVYVPQDVKYDIQVTFQIGDPSEPLKKGHEL